MKFPIFIIFTHPSLLTESHPWLWNLTGAVTYSAKQSPAHVPVYLGVKVSLSHPTSTHSLFGGSIVTNALTLIENEAQGRPVLFSWRVVVFALIGLYFTPPQHKFRVASLVFIDFLKRHKKNFPWLGDSAQAVIRLHPPPNPTHMHRCPFWI